MSISVARCLTLLFGLFFVSAAPLAAQSAAPAKAFVYLIYHKMAPGLTIQDALPIEREWRKLNQTAVDDGNMIGWYMMVKQMSSNPNPAEYDYVTVIVSPEMTIKGASPAARTKIYGDSAQVRMADLQKRDRATAPVVKMEIWETVDAVFSPGFAPDKTPIVVLDYIRLRDPLADWMSLVAPMKKLAASRVEKGQLAGWDFSALKAPSGSEKGYGLALVQCAASLGAIVNPDLTGSAEAAKIKTQQTRLFEVVRQEVFRLTEFTIYQKATAQATR